jgi:arginase
MTSSFVVVPQWQGSGSSRAMRLVDGAESIRQQLPSTATQVIDVPLEAGDAEGTGIVRYSSIRLVRERLQRALSDLDGTPIVVGGDCGVEYGAIEHASRSGRVVLLWADAHADLNTPESSPSGAFHGMVLRSLIDDGIVDAADVLLLGVRDLDDAEAEFIESQSLRYVTADEVGEAVSARALAAREAGHEPVLYAHVDLDVLDPAVFAGVGFATPFGLELAPLTQAITDARAALPLAGAGLTEYAPAVGDENGAGTADDEFETPGDDLSAILRIIAALSR